MRKKQTAVAGPTADEITGRVGRAPRRQEREKRLERAVVEFFSGTGQLVRSQVNCGFAGVADVVTADTIYELKDRLSRKNYYQALGQLLGYRNYLDPFAGMAIICNETPLSRMKIEKLERLNGVAVLVGSPPWEGFLFVECESEHSQF